MKGKLTDIHVHLLWGMDDGPDTPDGMYRMLQDAQQQGISRIAATPHVCPGFVPFDAGKYCERLSEAQAYCRAQGWEMDILPGAEIAWTYQTVEALRQGAVPCLGGTDRVLLELWRDISLQEAKTAVLSLIRAGFYPVLAHAERYRCFAWTPRQALRFREETGALFQMNAETLLHPRSAVEARFRNVMLKARAIDAVASDAHGSVGRPVNLRQAFDWLTAHTDEEYARLLTSFPV